MKFKLLVLLAIALISTSSYSSSSLEENKKSSPDISGYSKTFVESYNLAIKSGVNYNKNMYIFEYSCGGGAVCANIYDPHGNIFIDFPDNYLLENEDKEVEIKFSLLNNIICISGYSAYDLTYYDDTCYEYNENTSILSPK
jgi:hypothetical protein